MGKTLLSLHIAQQGWYLFIQSNLGRLLREENPYWAEALALHYEKQLVEQAIQTTTQTTTTTTSTSVHNLQEPYASLPLWMWMPFLQSRRTWRAELIETYAHQSHLLSEEVALLKKACQFRICRLWLIMDGWDELPPGVVTENLYLKSQFWEEDGWPYVKVLSTCRPEAFIHYEKSQGNYRSIFHPKPGAGSYAILNVSPFEPRHVEAYVQRYVAALPEDETPALLAIADPVLKPVEFDKAKRAWLNDYQRYTLKTYEQPLSTPEIEPESSSTTTSPDWHDPNTYLRYLNHIPGLSDLIQTPFVLSAVVQVLPTLAFYEARYQTNHISRYIVYQYFVDHWLTKQARRLWSDEKKRICLPEFHADDEEASIAKLKDCLLTYSENLARLALNLGEGKINVNLTDEDTSHPSLVIPPPGQTPYFDKEPVEKKKLHLIRSGCLLQNIDNHFKFLHKSLVEYFAAKMLFQGAHVAADYYAHRFEDQQALRHLDFNDHLLTAEPAVVHLLADKAREDLDFKYLLYQMIELSKGEPKVANAAANAITILNAAGESFSDRDFRGIHIPGAILNGALCSHTDFEGADLSNVSAQQIFLTNANLRRAKVEGLNFRELPRIKHTNVIKAFCIHSPGQWVLIGDGQGYVTQYSYPQGQLLKKWYRKPQCWVGKWMSLFANFNFIVALTLHPNGDLAACGGFDGSAQLIDVRRGFLGARFMPHAIAKAAFSSINGSTSIDMHFCGQGGRYLAFISEIAIMDVYKTTSYESKHLELWDVQKQRFLGKYSCDSTMSAIMTCDGGDTLIVKTDDTVYLFSIAQYVEGDFVPTRTLALNGVRAFVVSPDERLLTMVAEQTIQFYRTDDWMPQSSIAWPDKQRMQTLAFHPQGNLFAAKCDTRLYFWDLSSGQMLYTIPIPTAAKNIFDRAFKDWFLILSPLCFIPTVNEPQVAFMAGRTLYSLLLGRASETITYPLHPSSLSIPFLEKTVFLETVDTGTLFIKEERFSHSWSLITQNSVRMKLHDKLTGQTQYLTPHGMKYKLMLSTDQTYLVIFQLWKADYDVFGGVDAFSFVRKNISYFDPTLYVWHLKQKRLCYQVSPPDLCTTLFFSSDDQWLVSGSKEVAFIHQLDRGKLLHQFTLAQGNWVTALALDPNKHWLAVADSGNGLSLFDLSSNKRIQHFSQLPTLINNLEVTQDGHFLVATSHKKEGALTFRVLTGKKKAHLTLVHHNMDLNLVCSGIQIEGTQGLLADNLLLLRQNDAEGTPALLDQSKPVQAPETQFDTLPREFRFEHAVLQRSSVASFLNQKAILDYSVWQVALVRDSKSAKNSQHTFIMVEGMDAFGRCFFWRFDLATKIGEEEVRQGFAKVVIDERQNIALSERTAILDTLLNPREEQGRGLESLVGDVWQLQRPVVLQLYSEVKADAKDLLPYAQGGNMSFFSRGDSCYSWARRRLLALGQEEIDQRLPYRVTDYIAMVPSWKLMKSLTPQPEASTFSLHS